MTGPALGWHGVSRVHDATRRSPAVTALHDLTLEGQDGELLVLVGPSGSGKSTALRVLAGIEPLQSGTVTITGRDVTDAPPHRRDVAMVFQDLALFPHLDVRGNILFGPTLRSMPSAEQAERLDRVSGQLGLSDLMDRRPSELSGGQRQRVALARAMVRDPAVFLLDEPLANLDARLRLEAREEIVALQRRLGTTMVFVTHDQAEAMTMGHRVAVLRAGRLEQVGTPREIYDHPATRFVATFLGTPPMSMIPGDTLLHPTGAATEVGIRAEDLVLADPPVVLADSHSQGLDGQVAMVEDLGPEVIVYVQTQAGRLAVRRPRHDDTRPGQSVRVSLSESAHVHEFDAVTGERTG